ncbi:D-ribose ABC transporter substrate-binding protein [Mycolicibacterium litorale]|uniref:D-ribose ABC transporter substrate-binding protein n=1 Tax=Mycolicibacterium litorale TaxID=758802 RepID=A0A6S6P6Y5_9MYCO|nr:sugar ABC transporter substrate-binding protein [Mycolicibacterium litorale]BCI54355.1 D-ribose ABC transporter substrate-binding protein [Mycolicibacterium litorale]
MNLMRIATAATLTLALTVSGCSSGDESRSATGGSADGIAGQPTYVLTLTRSNPTQSNFADTITEDLQAAGLKVVTEYSEYGAGADQMQKFNQALSTKPAAIVLWPTDTTSLIPAYARARQQSPDTKIVVGIYQPATDDDGLYDAFWGYDEEKIGASSARAIVDGLTAQGKPVQGAILQIEGSPGGATTILRKKGFEETLAEIAPDLKIVSSMTANWDGTEATTVAAQMFSRHAADSIVGVFAHSDVMLDGAMLAGDRAGAVAGRDYVAVGADCDPVGYRNIEAGKQYATALWDPFALGRTGAEVTVDLLTGGEVQKSTTLDASTITKDNLATCDEAIGKYE